MKLLSSATLASMIVAVQSDYCCCGGCLRSPPAPLGSCYSTLFRCLGTNELEMNTFNGSGSCGGEPSPQFNFTGACGSRAYEFATTEAECTQYNGAVIEGDFSSIECVWHSAGTASVVTASVAAVAMATFIVMS